MGALKTNSGFLLLCVLYSLSSKTARSQRGSDCKTTTEGLEYTGTIHRTRSGIVCQRWDKNYPHIPKSTLQDSHFPDGSKTKAGNYCRNPDKDPRGPWCYTTDLRKRYEFCDIPICTNQPKCPKFFTGIGSSCYFLALWEPMQWDLAKATCEVYGGYLAELETRDEIQTIQQFLLLYEPLHEGRQCSLLGETNGIFIGVKQLRSGALIWARSEKAVIHFDWYPGEPDRINIPNTQVVIALSCANGFKWEDNDHFTDQKYFLCETDPEF